MIDEKRALTIARKAFGLNLTSMPDDLYKLVNEAVKDEQDRIVVHFENDNDGLGRAIASEIRGLK